MKIRTFRTLQKTNTHLYTNYFKFAKRKLNACEQLVNSMPDFEDKALEKKVCHELFYLMGYIVEGLSVYVIYDVLEWDKSKEISRYDKNFADEYDLSWDGDTTYTIKRHRFNSYLSVVRGKYEVADIPFISGSDSNVAQYKHLSKWTPELRYDLNDIDLTKNDIIDLYKYCNNMYTSVVNIIGPVL